MVMDCRSLAAYWMLAIALVSILHMIQEVGVAARVNCSEGSYYSETDNSCKECGICPENELLTQPCTATRNTICHCKPGYYRLYPTWGYIRDTCMECSSCGNRQVVANCSESQDTECGDCPLDYFIYNATLCAPCSICIQDDPFAIRMKACEESGLPPWHQCSPKVVTSSDIFIFNTTIPAGATQPTFVSSSTVDSVNGGAVQETPQGIVIAGWTTVSLTLLMAAVCMCTCGCCAMAMYCQRRPFRLHCTQCKKQRNGSGGMCCCPVTNAQRQRIHSGTADSDAEPLCNSDDEGRDHTPMSVQNEHLQQPLCI